MKNTRKSFKENIARKASRIIGEKAIDTIGSSTQDCMFWFLDEPKMPEELLQHNLKLKMSDKK